MKTNFNYILSSTGKHYVQAMAQHVDEDGVISTKRGFIELQSAPQANALIEKLSKGERVATLGRPNRDGICPVTLTSASAVVEAEGAEEEQTLTTPA